MMPDEISKWINALSDDDVAQRADAAEQLCYLAEDAQPAAVPLARAVGDADEIVREWAVAALEGMGSPDPADAPALAELLDHQNADTGYWAATLLGRLEAGAAAAVPNLVAVLTEPAAMPVRQRACWALGKIGPAARSAVDSLRKVASSDDARLARLARQALEKIVQSDAADG